MNAPAHITSRHNPVIKHLRMLARQNMAYRQFEGQIWIEGEHLCTALLASAQRPELAIFTPTAWERASNDGRWASSKVHIVSEALMADISALPSPPGMGFVWRVPPSAAWKPDQATVVLDGLQDPGNVGSILRSAAALGFGQIVALKGTAALWSPKVLRAGMGAHFSLHLSEGCAIADLARLSAPLLCTSSHQGAYLHESALPWPCAWVFGHEGRGLSTELLALSQQCMRIAQPGGQESLNVAAAAAICLHASAVAKHPKNHFLHCQ